MDNNTIRGLLDSNKMSEDKDSPESHQSKESPGDLSESRIMEILRAEREALLRQIDTMQAAERARTNALLERLGLLNQQDPVPSPQPPAAPRQRPGSSVKGRRIRAVSSLPCGGTLEAVSNFRSPRHKRSPEIQEEKVEEVNLHRDQSSGPSPRIDCEDSHPPSQLRPTSQRRRPVEVSPPLAVVHPPCSPSPPAVPRPRRRTSGIPMMSMDLSGTSDKDVGEDRLQAAKHQQETAVHVPRPPAAQRRNSAFPPVAPAPPPNPAPPQKRGPRRGTFLHPATKRIDNTWELQTDEKNQEELNPPPDPAKRLSNCFKLLSSDDWEKKLKGLRGVRALVQHHPDTLKLHLYDVCKAVTAEVKNLRSSVTCAAMDTIVFLHASLPKDMDSHVEMTSRALLLKIAASTASQHLLQQVNVTLDALVEHCSPGRVLNALISSGLSGHQCVAVRARIAQLLSLLADRLGADAVLTAGQRFIQRLLVAASKLSLDTATQVRAHGQAIIQVLAPHSAFAKLWMKFVAKNDQCLLEKIMKNATRDEKIKV